MVSARSSDGLPVLGVLCLGLSSTGVPFSLARWPVLELLDDITGGVAGVAPSRATTGVV